MTPKNPEPPKRYEVRPTEGKISAERPPEFYYVQIGSNGEDLNVSETYTRRQDAVRGVYDANPEPRNVEIVHVY